MFLPIFAPRSFMANDFRLFASGKNVVFIAAGGIKIGHRSMIGHGSQIITAGHNIPPKRAPMRFTGAYLKEVVIENDVWLGAGVIVLPGVTIGEGAIVGAGAVVTKDIPPFAVVAGVPAEIIRMRD
ncbi:Maltose O-acetyltransferase [subsurface metagenome]